MSRQIRTQKTRIVNSRKDASKTEQSQYWDDVYKGHYGADESGFKENIQANPDQLPESENGNPSTPQLLMGEAIQHLQGRQRECYLLTMREDKSLAEVAEILNISKSTVQQYRERAIKFITKWCETQIAKGRV